MNHQHYCTHRIAVHVAHLRNPVSRPYAKGQLFRDLGLADWFFESGHTTGQQLWDILKPLHDDRAAGRARVQEAMNKAAAIQKRMVEVLEEAVSKHRSRVNRK